MLSYPERTLHGLVKDNAGAIDKLTQNLLKLKNDFDSGVTIQTAIVSFRVHEDVGKIHCHTSKWFQVESWTFL
jgi:hypothetical protein